MEVVAFAVGGFGLVYGVWSSILLLRWARECRGTRIAIAYKQKVKIDAPLTEYMLWARQARKDKESRARGPGRIIYTAAGTSILIVQRPKARTIWKMKLQRRLSRGSNGRKARESETSSGAPTSSAQAGRST